MAEDDPVEGEHAFLRRLRARLQARGVPEAPPEAARLLLGPGDDAAVFAPGPDPIAITTDALIEEVHFRVEWLNPRELGRRAVEVNLSDLAAMAARPRFVLAAVAAPASTGRRSLEELLEGCADAAERAGAALIGGNLSRADVLSVTVTALGEIPGRRLERSGARPGDVLIVTGTLGDAACALAAWQRGESPSETQRRRWCRPRARLRAGLVLAEAGAHAAIDLSDGLLADLSHLCEASGVGAVIEREHLPRTPEVAELDARGSDLAATGGEDYELLVAAPPELTAELDALAVRADVPLTVVGRCDDRSGEIRLLGPDRRELPLPAGFDHFARPDART